MEDSNWGDLQQKDISHIEKKNVQGIDKTSCDVSIGDCGFHKKTGSRIEVAEMKMMRFFLEVTRLDKIKNEII